MRKVGNTLKDSVYNQIIWAIEQLGLTSEFRILKSPLEIIYKPTGQTIYFRGLDDPLKAKSIKPTFGVITSYSIQYTKLYDDEHDELVGQLLHRVELVVRLYLVRPFVALEIAPAVIAGLAKIT